MYEMQISVIETINGILYTLNQRTRFEGSYDSDIADRAQKFARKLGKINNWLLRLPDDADLEDQCITVGNYLEPVEALVNSPTLIASWYMHEPILAYAISQVSGLRHEDTCICCK